MAKPKRIEKNVTGKGRIALPGANFPDATGGFDPLCSPYSHDTLPIPANERRGLNSTNGSFEAGEKGTGRTGSGN